MKKVKKVIKKRKSVLCTYCNAKNNIPHMTVSLNKSGDIHVHAPFENKYLMVQFIDAIIREQQIFNSKNKNDEKIIKK